MTVKDLIARLSAMPPGVSVLLCNADDIVCGTGGVKHVPRLSDYPCAGFDFGDFDFDSHGEVVVISAEEVE